MLDIADTNSVFDTINRTRPDLVIHCAAMTDVDGCERDPDAAFKINAVGTWNLACACASVDCAIAYVSTDYVFNGEKGSPYTEFDTVDPISAYGASKLGGEMAVRELCRKHYVVRTSWVFAPARQELRQVDTRGGGDSRRTADSRGPGRFADLCKGSRGVFGVAGRFAPVWGVSFHQLGRVLVV